MTLTITDALLIAVSGLSVVFMLLILLQGSVLVTSMVIQKIQKTNHASNYNSVQSLPDAPHAKETSDVKSSSNKTEITGAYSGNISLVDVDEKTAACIIAIVSEETKIPLNELIVTQIRAL